MGYHLHIRIVQEINIQNGRVSYQGFYKGEVANFDPIAKTVLVKIEPDDIKDEESEYQYDFDDLKLLWFPPLRDEHNQIVKYPYNMRLTDPVIYEDEVEIVEPANRRDMIGCRMRWYSSKTKYRDGKVVDVDLSTDAGTGPGVIKLSCKSVGKVRGTYELVVLPFAENNSARRGLPRRKWYSKEYEEPKHPSSKPHISEALRHYFIEIPSSSRHLIVPVDLEAFEDGHETDVYWLTCSLYDVDVKYRTMKIDIGKEVRSNSDLNSLISVEYDASIIKWFARHKVYI